MPISIWMEAPRATAARGHATTPCKYLALVVFALLAFLAFSGQADAATLTVNVAGPGSGYVKSDPPGFLCETSCQAEPADGASVILIAIPGLNSTWSGWTGACTGVASQCTVSMSEARSVTATFKIATNVRVNRSGTGTGTVTSSPAGLACGSACTFGFAYGTQVTLTASAAAGSSFTGWSGSACSGTATTCTVEATTSLKQVGAIFTLLPIRLTVVTQGTGAGTVTSSPSGIDCGSACHYSFVNGAKVTLTEIPAPGSGFSGWSGGGCVAMAMTCTVTANVAKTVAATFTELPGRLTVTAAGTGSGSISSAPLGILCGAMCEASYADGASVTLTATPAAHSSFTGWSGACSGASPTCTVSVGAATSVVASFDLVSEPLTVVNTGSGEGTVSGTPAGIDCGATCQADFPHGTVVTLTAVAAAGSYFTGWTGACADRQPTCTVTVDGATSVTATFTYFVTVSLKMGGSGHGMVVSSPLYVLCEEDCDRLVPINAQTWLGAIPDDDSVFIGWSGACTGTGDCSISPGEAITVTANFALLFRAWFFVNGTGNGTITSDPGGRSCTRYSDCTGTFYSPGDVTLTAVAQPGSSFTGWSGACTGTSPTCVVPPDLATSVTATFDLLPVHLVVAKAGTGSGAITSASGSIDCGAACNADIPALKLFRLTAVAAPGSSFAGWSGECSGVSDCWVWSDTDVSVTATFTVDPPAPVEPVEPASPPALSPVSEPSGTTAPVGTAPAQVVQSPAAESAVAPAARAKAGLAVRARPKLTGRARVGRTLVCTRGTWIGSPARYAFTWLRDGRIVARGASRVIRAVDRGHSIRCMVTVKNAGGSASAKTSAVRIPR